MTKLHPKLALALRRRPQLRAKPKHSIQTTIRQQRKVLGPNLRIVDYRIPLIQQAHNITLELVGRGDCSLHKRLEDLWSCFFERFAESARSGGLEGHFGGICEMDGAVVDYHAG